MTDAQRFYIIAMLMITVKKRQGTIAPAGIIRAIKTMRNLNH